MDYNIIFVDLETGGYNFQKNSITNIALVGYDGEKICFEVDTLVKPYQYKVFQHQSDGPICIVSKENSWISKYYSATLHKELVCEESALNYTGLTLEKLEKEGMDGETLYKELCVIFKDFKRGKKLPLLCGHNVDEFDKAFLEFLFTINGDNLYDYVSKHFIDTLWLSRFLLGSELVDNHKLETLCNYFNINLSDAHGALADTKSTMELYLKLQEFGKNTEIKIGEGKQQYRQFQL